MAYMITCLVDPRRESARAALKADHLRYVGSRRPELVFGGVVEAPDGSLQRVVYFVEASTEAEAWAFVVGDPYTALYETISVAAFQQRIPPRPYPRTVLDPFDFPADLAPAPQ
jgi:uncharacterized protein YciI